MKKLFRALLLFAVISLSSCSKDETTPFVRKSVVDSSNSFSTPTFGYKSSFTSESYLASLFDLAFEGEVGTKAMGHSNRPTQKALDIDLQPINPKGPKTPVNTDTLSVTPTYSESYYINKYRSYYDDGLNLIQQVLDDPEMDQETKDTLSALTACQIVAFDVYMNNFMEFMNQDYSDSEIENIVDSYLVEEYPEWYASEFPEWYSEYLAGTSGPGTKGQLYQALQSPWVNCALAVTGLAGLTSAILGGSATPAISVIRGAIMSLFKGGLKNATKVFARLVSRFIPGASWIYLGSIVVSYGACVYDAYH